MVNQKKQSQQCHTVTYKNPSVSDLSIDCEKNYESYYDFNKSLMLVPSNFGSTRIKSENNYRVVLGI